MQYVSFVLVSFSPHGAGNVSEVKFLFSEISCCWVVYGKTKSSESQIRALQELICSGYGFEQSNRNFSFELKGEKKLQAEPARSRT